MITMTLDIERVAQSIARMDRDDLANLADVLPALKWDIPEGGDTRAQTEILLSQVVEAQEAYERG
ncbi:hypothetical protein AB0B01_04420 [Streptomyces sp. NPDC044571]|uniref:hypothetical protein n=1 Tax=Streptomyces sp. NPDC044571 TaxID=3155371 RepID=UPI0033E90438